MGSYGYFDDLNVAVEDDLDNAFQRAREKGTVADLPDGTYQGYIEEAMLKDSSKYPGEFGLYFKICVLTEGFAGRRVTKFTTINMAEPETTMNRIKPDLMVMGFQWAGVRSLDDPDRFAKILDTIVDFRVSHKKSKTNDKEYMNIWLNRSHGFVDAATRREFGTKD